MSLGGGRTLLEYMHEYDLKKRTIFVIRKYGGVRMGIDRFTCYKIAANDAVRRNSCNEVLNVQQPVPKDEEIYQRNKPANRRNRANYGTK